MRTKHQSETVDERVRRVARRLRKPVEVVEAKLRELEAEQAAQRGAQRAADHEAAEAYRLDQARRLLAAFGYTS